MAKAKAPIDFYFWPTPNGFKIRIMLEECGLAYNLKPVDISKGDQFKPKYLAISPNNKLPAIVDDRSAQEQSEGIVARPVEAELAERPRHRIDRPVVDARVVVVRFERRERAQRDVHRGPPELEADFSRRSRDSASRSVSPPSNENTPYSSCQYRGISRCAT